MMKNQKRSLLLSCLVAFGTILSAQTINGRLVDEKGEPLSFANVSLLSLPDSAFVSGSTSDEKGAFSLKELPRKSYLLQVSYVGYQPQSIKIDNLDRKINLGDIKLAQDAVALEGVTVTASNVVNKVDRQVIVPSQRQVKASNSGYELLSHMQLPGLKINLEERIVSTVGGGSVQLRINDIAATTAQVQALRPGEVIRVEYIDNPGLRYADTGVEAVINYVVRRKEAGVAGGVNLMNAFTTGFGNDNVYVKGNYKLSEFGLSYYLNYRDYTDRASDEDQVFNTPEGDRNRYLKGINTPFDYNMHNLELTYNLTKPDKYVLNVLFADNIYDAPHRDMGQVIQETGYDDIYNFLIASNTYNSPSLDLYGKVYLPKQQELTLNVVGTYIGSDYNRDYTESLTEGGEPYSEYAYSTDGKRYSLTGEGIYKKDFKRVALSAGLKYTLAYTNNEYVGDVNQVNDMHSSSLYGYVQASGTWQKLGYMAGVGISRETYDEDGKGYGYNMFRPSASLSYQLFDGATVRYTFSCSPSIPSLSLLSDVRQQLTDLEVQRGNANLKPYRTYSNTLQLSWGNKWVNTQLRGRYYIAQNPIMAEVSRITEDDGSYIFQYTYDNQDRFSLLNGQLYASVNIVPDMLSLELYGGLNHYESRGNAYSHNYNNWYGGTSLSFNYRNFSTYAAITSRSNTLSGEQIYYGEKYSTIRCSYKIKNISVGLGLLYPFQAKGWSGGSELLSQDVKKKSWTYIRDNGNMLTLNLSWNFNYGKKHNAEGKTTNNVDRETGIAM